MSNALLGCHALLRIPLQTHLNKIDEACVLFLSIQDVFQTLGAGLPLLSFFLELWSVLIIEKQEFARANTEQT